MLEKFVQKLFKKKIDIIYVLVFFFILSIIPIILINTGNILLLACGFVCILISLIMSDVQDTVRFHYEKSIFNAGPDSYWKCDWRRKYIDGDPAKGHRKFLFGLLDIPAFWYDAWHLAKIIEIWMQWNMLYYLAGLIINLSCIYYIIYLIIAGIITYYFHVHIFYGGIFVKKENKKSLILKD